MDGVRGGVPAPGAAREFPRVRLPASAPATRTYRAAKAGQPQVMRITNVMARLENAEALDRPATWLRALVEKVPRGPVRDTLHGVPLGHPMHSALVHLPLGAWASAAILDFMPRTGPASATLIAVGLGGAVPAAASGAVDLAATRKPQQRVGIAHAACNLAAVGMYSASLIARVRRRPWHGRMWSTAGLAAISVGGFLGGHLAYRQATGANHADHVPFTVEDHEWHAVGPLEALPDGRAVRRHLGDTPLLVVRRGDEVDVLADRCAHLDGPLSEGDIDVEDGCVVCPWHESTYRLSDGEVIHGPATAPQPVFETRLDEKGVWVRMPA